MGNFFKDVDDIGKRKFGEEEERIPAGPFVRFKDLKLLFILFLTSRHIAIKSKQQRNKPSSMAFFLLRRLK